MKRIGFLVAVVFALSAAVHAQAISITLSNSNEQGWLNCPEADVSTRCWFKSTTPILQAGVYSGQVSWMETKNREGIIIFGGPNNLSSGRGIFIHVGNSPSDSANCVVIPGSEMRKLYSALESSYGRNNVFRIRIEWDR
jgi:hypothetical protein